MAVNPIPEGYHTLQIYLAVEDASKAIDFYKEAFGAEETIRMPGPDGSVAHAELQIGDSKLMLSDPFPQSNVRPPSERGGPTASIFMYVDDVDAVVPRAVSAGAKVVRQVQDQFYGDRSGSVVDPYGHIWHVATHKEDLSMEEIGKRAAAQHTG